MTQPAATTARHESGDLVSALTVAVRGTVVSPADPRYDEARQVHNGAVDNRPAAVVHVASPADVHAALRVSAERGLHPTVRGGGTDPSGAATSGDVVLDLRGLRAVSIDPERRTARVRGGAIWSDLDQAAAAYGLCAAGPRTGVVGVVGAVLSGGDGWLTARHGSAHDNVVEHETVSINGAATGADAPRPGADELGAPTAVTWLTLRLHELPDEVLGGELLFRLADADEVVATIARLVATGNEYFAPMLRWMPAPATSWVPGDVVGHPVLSVLPSWVGPVDEGWSFLAELLGGVPALADTVRPMSYLTAQRQCDGLDGWGRRRAEAPVVRDVGAATVRELEAAITERPGPWDRIELTPSAGGSGWSLRGIAQWTDRAEDEAHRQWLARLALPSDAPATASHHDVPAAGRDEPREEPER